MTVNSGEVGASMWGASFLLYLRKALCTPGSKSLLNKEVRAHPGTDRDHHPAHMPRIHLLREECSVVSADRRAHQHQQRLRPDHGAVKNKCDDRDSITNS